MMKEKKARQERIEAAIKQANEQNKEEEFPTDKKKRI